MLENAAKSPTNANAFALGTYAAWTAASLPSALTHDGRSWFVAVSRHTFVSTPSGMPAAAENEFGWVTAGPRGAGESTVSDERAVKGM